MRYDENKFFRPTDVLRKKRDGLRLTEEEIRSFTEGYVKGEIPDYQVAAFLMATYFRGLDEEETSYLTFAIRDSGEKNDFSGIRGIRADKHSTGGVGDKTSLIVGPVVAACGVSVAKISGRGLGHTGGTVDKLEAIPGFKTDLSEEAFVAAVNRVGLAIVGQSKAIAPADKKLYALRDVTETVDSIPLIAASIMGKKLAAGDDCIVLDVKTGSGAFMKDRRDAEKLAKVMVDIGRRAGKKISALITDMDRPLGRAVGNAAEVNEATELLRGKGDERLRELCLALSAEILFLAGKGTREDCLRLAEDALDGGAAYKKYLAFIAEQGGDVAAAERGLPLSGYAFDLVADGDGYVLCTDAEAFGKASALLGAGREKLEDTIDAGAGLLIRKAHGEFVKKGETIVTAYTSDPRRFAGAEECLRRGMKLGDVPPQTNGAVLERIEGKAR